MNSTPKAFPDGQSRCPTGSFLGKRLIAAGRIFTLPLLSLGSSCLHSRRGGGGLPCLSIIRRPPNPHPLPPSSLSAPFFVSCVPPPFPPLLPPPTRSNS